MRELLIGAGNNRERKLSLRDHDGGWINLTTLDIDPLSEPDVVHDLNELPWPFEDDTFHEIHAYEVLEHLGHQGDYNGFFAIFTEIWRILTPGGVLIGTSPKFDSPWTWGDPGHTRVITKEALTFLDQDQYTNQVGMTAMTDYRSVYTADFKMLAATSVSDASWGFALEAVKPSRYEGDA